MEVWWEYEVAGKSMWLRHEFQEATRGCSIDFEDHGKNFGFYSNYDEKPL